MLLCGIWEAKPSEAKTKIVVFMGGEKDGKILFTWYSDKHRKDECVWRVTGQHGDRGE